MRDDLKINSSLSIAAKKIKMIQETFQKEHRSDTRAVEPQFKFQAPALAPAPCI